MQRDRELRAREERVKALEAGDWRKEAEADPYAWAEKTLGITYDGYTSRLLAGGKPEAKDPAKEALAKVETLQKELADQRAKEAEARTAAQHDSEITKFRASITETVAKNDAYELCRTMGEDAVDQVQEVVRAHAIRTGELLPLAEALSLVEGYYEEQANALLATKKIAAKTTPVAPPPAPAPAAKPSPTLTAKDAPSSTPAAPPRGKDAEWRALQQKYKGQILKPSAKAK